MIDETYAPDPAAYTYNQFLEEYGISTSVAPGLAFLNGTNASRCISLKAAVSSLGSFHTQSLNSARRSATSCRRLAFLNSTAASAYVVHHVIIRLDRTVSAVCRCATLLLPSVPDSFSDSRLLRKNRLDSLAGDLGSLQVAVHPETASPDIAVIAFHTQCILFQQRSSQLQSLSTKSATLFLASLSPPYRVLREDELL